MGFKRTRQRIKEKEVFIKYFRNIFLILVIPYIILSGVYYGASKRIKTQIYESIAESLMGSTERVEMLFDNLDNISLYLADNMDIVNFLNASSGELKKNVTIITKAQTNLPAMKLGNSDILNIQIYSEQNDILIDGFTGVVNLERYYGSFFILDGIGEGKFKTDYLREKKVVSYGQNSMKLKGSWQDALIYNKIFTGINTMQKNNRIIFYLDRESVLGEVTDSSIGETSYKCFADENGAILFGSPNGEAIFDKIPFEKLAEDKGYLIEKIDGEKYLLAYCKSASRNWICVEAAPLRAIPALADMFHIVMAMMLLFAMFVGVVFVFVIAKKLARPIEAVGDILGKDVPLEDYETQIGQLVKNNTELKEKMDSQLTIMRTEAFYNMFVCSCNGDEDIKEQLDKIGIRKDARQYAVLLLNCNDMGADTALEEISAQKVYIEEWIRAQNIPQVQDIYQIDFERMIILMASEEEAIGKMRDVANELGEALIKELSDKGYSVSVSGDIVGDVLKLPKSFIHVQKAESIPQNIGGVGKIQWYDKVKQYNELMLLDNNAKTETVAIQNQVLVEKVKKYIMDNYSNSQLSLSMVGEEFYITEVYLSKLFKRATGVNFSKYLEELRVQRAKELLQGGMKVADAAARVGYNSTQVFRRAYKRYYGCIPSEHHETSLKEEGQTGVDEEV